MALFFGTLCADNRNGPGIDFSGVAFSFATGRGATGTCGIWALPLARSSRHWPKGSRSGLLFKAFRLPTVRMLVLVGLAHTVQPVNGNRIGGGLRTRWEPHGSLKRPRRSANRAYEWAYRAGIGTLIGCLVSITTPFLNPVYMERWFSWPQSSTPYQCRFSSSSWRTFSSKRWPIVEYAPFAAAIGLFFYRTWESGISFYPYLVPTQITIWDAAAPDSSLAFVPLVQRRCCRSSGLYRLFLLGIPRKSRR